MAIDCMALAFGSGLLELLQGTACPYTSLLGNLFYAMMIGGGVIIPAYLKTKNFFFASILTAILGFALLPILEGPARMIAILVIVIGLGSGLFTAVFGKGGQ